MFFLKVYFYVDVVFTLWALPVLYLYVIKPNKSIIEGFTDWFNEY